MDFVAKEREVLAVLLDRCMAELESMQKEQLQRHRLLVEELIFRELDRFCGKVTPHRGTSQQQQPDEAALLRAMSLVGDSTDADSQGAEVPGDDGLGGAFAGAVWGKDYVRTGIHKDRPLIRNGGDYGITEQDGHNNHETKLDCIHIANPSRGTSFSEPELASSGTKRLRFSMAAGTPPDGLKGRSMSGFTTVSERHLNLHAASKLAQQHLLVPSNKGGLGRSTMKRNRDVRYAVFHPQGFVHGTLFNLASALLIVGNAVFIGYQTHVSVQNEFLRFLQPVSQPSWASWEFIFLGCFSLELALRIGNDRLNFIRGDEWRWNVFDSVIVGVSLVETTADSILDGLGVNFPFLRLVRVVRVLRILKVLHMIPFFRRLGLMMTSVVASLSALAPAFVLLVLVMYLFGICLMQGVINYMAEVQELEPWMETLDARFSRLDITMSTLFMAITSGISWVECLDALTRMGGFYDLILIFYIFFVDICVLNIVTGVFVDTVHQMYRPEREEMIQREISKRKQVLKNLRNLLEEADEDDSGTITWDEFEDFMSDEQIKMYLASLEIDITQARDIFDLLDSDSKSEVGIDEFVLGFLEIKGTAKGADVLILRNNVHKLSLKMNQFINDVLGDLGELKDRAWYLRQRPMSATS